MTKNIPLLQMIRNKSKRMITEHIREDKDMPESLRFSCSSIIYFMCSLFHWPLFAFVLFLVPQLYHSLLQQFNKRPGQLVQSSELITLYVP